MDNWKIVNGASVKMFNFEKKKKNSPGYRHMICIGKTKSTSEK